MLATTNTRALWYLTRGTGLVCLLLLTASVVLGILEVKRWANPSWPRFVTAGLHKNVSLLVTAFLAVHITTAVVDGFAPIRWLDVILPFTSRYRPIWLGFGALAFDLLIALIITSLLRQRLGYRAWRVVHWMSYLCWPVALVHGLGTGTDIRRGWVLLITMGCLAAVLGALWWRLAGGQGEWDGVRAGAAGLSVIAPLVIVVWMLAGPLHPGWAARAGTPANLLASGNGSSTGSASSSTGNGSSSGNSSSSATGSSSASSAPAPFTANLNGTITETGPDARGNTTVTIDGTLSGGASGTLHIELQGPADRGGGVEMASSAVTLGITGHSGQYKGQITRLGGTSINATVTDPAGRSLNLGVDLQIDRSGARVSGTVQATAGGSGQG